MEALLLVAALNTTGVMLDNSSSFDCSNEFTCALDAAGIDYIGSHATRFIVLSSADRVQLCDIASTYEVRNVVVTFNGDTAFCD